MLPLKRSAPNRTPSKAREIFLQGFSYSSPGNLGNIKQLGIPPMIRPFDLELQQKSSRLNIRANKISFVRQNLI
jgi:hypothetical protein